MTTVSGIELVTRQGRKSPDDLVLLVRGSDGRWRAVEMELAFYLVDFFAENEQALLPYRGHWLRNGDTYFMSKCVEAIRSGWRQVAAEVRRQRGRTPA